MAGIDKHGGVTRLDLFEERRNCLIHVAAVEIRLEDDLIEALGLQNIGVALSIGHGFL